MTDIEFARAAVVRVRVVLSPLDMSSRGPDISVIPERVGALGISPVDDGTHGSNYRPMSSRPACSDTF